MASFIGSVATEIGEGLQENVVMKREDRHRTEDRARDLQLEKQRQRFETSLIDKRLSAEDKRASRTIEANKVLEENRQSFESGYRDADRTQSNYEAQLKAETDIITTAMRAFIVQSESGMARGNDWTTQITPSINMETGQQENIIYAENDGRTYRQVGDKMFYAGGPAKQLTEFATPDLQRKAEAPLYGGEITAETFNDIHGYIPAGYVFGKVAQGSDFGSFLKKNNIRFPAFMLGGDRRIGGGSIGFDAVRQQEVGGKGGSGGYPTTPSPKRDAKIASQGQPVESEPVDVAGGRLAQGQAAAGEAPAPLETGGQLEAPPVAQQAPGGGELDEAGAAEIVKSMGAFEAIKAQSPVLQRLGRVGEGEQANINLGSAQ